MAQGTQSTVVEEVWQLGWDLVRAKAEAKQKTRSSDQRQGWSEPDELLTPWDPHLPTPPPSPEAAQPPHTVLPIQEHTFQTCEPLADIPHSYHYIILFPPRPLWFSLS